MGIPPLPEEKNKKIVQRFANKCKAHHASHWILPVVIDENKIPHFTQVVTVTKRNQAVFFFKIKFGLFKDSDTHMPIQGEFNNKDNFLLFKNNGDRLG